MAKVDYIRKYAPGGQMAPPQEAPAATATPEAATQAAPEEAGANGQQDQMMQQLTQVVQTQDPNAALEFCNNLASAAGIQPGGQEQPAEEGAAMADDEGSYARGGKIKVKMSAGAKMKSGKAC